jgi:hypothetical protein
LIVEPPGVVRYRVDQEAVEAFEASATSMSAEQKAAFGRARNSTGTLHVLLDTGALVALARGDSQRTPRLTSDENIVRYPGVTTEW